MGTYRGILLPRNVHKIKYFSRSLMKFRNNERSIKKLQPVELHGGASTAHRDVAPSLPLQDQGHCIAECMWGLK